eukprot:scaffold117928_cov32-Prasinocladus_malaysianus.AAC.3
MPELEPGTEPIPGFARLENTPQCQGTTQTVCSRGGRTRNTEPTSAKTTVSSCIRISPTFTTRGPLPVDCTCLAFLSSRQHTSCKRKWLLPGSCNTKNECRGLALVISVDNEEWFRIVLAGGQGFSAKVMYPNATRAAEYSRLMKDGQGDTSQPGKSVSQGDKTSEGQIPESTIIAKLELDLDDDDETAMQDIFQGSSHGSSVTSDDSMSESTNGRVSNPLYFKTGVSKTGAPVLPLQRWFEWMASLSPCYSPIFAETFTALRVTANTNMLAENNVKDAKHGGLHKKIPVSIAEHVLKAPTYIAEQAVAGLLECAIWRKACTSVISKKAHAHLVKKRDADIKNVEKEMEAHKAKTARIEDKFNRVSALREEVCHNDTSATGMQTAHRELVEIAQKPGVDEDCYKKGKHQHLPKISIEIISKLTYALLLAESIVTGD